jgi:hypothetical protein
MCSADELHDPNTECTGNAAPQLKSHAALAGMSLSDYLLSKIREIAERPTL